MSELLVTRVTFVFNFNLTFQYFFHVFRHLALLFNGAVVLDRKDHWVPKTMENKAGL